MGSFTTILLLVFIPMTWWLLAKQSMPVANGQLQQGLRVHGIP